MIFALVVHERFFGGGHVDEVVCEVGISLAAVVFNAVEPVVRLADVPLICIPTLKFAGAETG